MFSHNDGSLFSNDAKHIYYESIGDEDAYPLVFLHGGLQNIKTFNEMLKVLPTDRYRIIGIDTNGHGKSNLSGDLTYKSIQNDVESVLKYLNITKCSVIGHSDGGVVALRLAISQNIKIDKVVAIGAHWKLEADEQSLEFYQGLTANKWQDRFPDEVEYYYRINPKPSLDKLLSQSIKLWTDCSDSGYPGDSIAHINIPTFIIRGDDDFLVSKQHSFEMSSIIKGSKLLNLPYSGHSVHIDGADVVGKLLEKFL